MPSTITETVTVDREEIIAALAYLEGALNLLTVLNDNTTSRAVDRFLEARSALQIAAFGDKPESDLEFETNPVEVEVWARGDEIAADVLEAMFEEGFDGPLRFVAPEIVYELRSRIRSLRAHAAYVREHGTIGTPRDG